jgi:hypothetical protein
MKKISLLLLSAAAITAFAFTGTSDFEGKVVYSMDLGNAKMPAEAKSMFAGSELTLYIKGTKTRSDMQMGPQITSTIYDGKTNTSVTLMEMMGNKYKIKNDNTKKTDDKKPEIKVNVTTETKTIAGYPCKKAEVTMVSKDGTSHASSIWFTESIANHMYTSDDRGAQFRDIKGMPLEYEIEAENGMTMKMTAKTINKEKIPDSQFDIPADYKETTMEDLQKEMMKMMGGQH